MTTEFIFLTLPGYRQVEQLACLEVLSEAQAICGSISIHRISLSSPGELWRTQGLIAGRPNTALVVCSGSPETLQSFDCNVGTAIGAAWREDVTLFAVGTASHYLAKMGLLNARRVAARTEELARLKACCEFVRWDDSVCCTSDRNLVTSDGFLGAAEGTVLTLRCMGKVAVAGLVASRLKLRTPHPGHDMGLEMAGRLAIHPAVQRATEALRRRPLDTWTTAAIARVACVSERHLQRLFKAEYSCGVLEYLQRLRLQRATIHFKANPYVNLEQIALTAGFSSTQQLRRVWRKEHGYSPSELRKKMGLHIPAKCDTPCSLL